MFDSDGLRLHLRAWHPGVTPRAVVLIVPGFNAHSAYYAWAAEQLVADRFAVYALDLRGRGLSDGERFYVDTFDDYVADVTRFVALAKSKEPVDPFSCSVTAPAASSRAYSPSIIRQSSRASSVRASRTKCRRRTSRSRCSRD